MVADTASRLFQDLFWPDGVWSGHPGWDSGKWDVIESAGLPLALVPEDAGGFGLARRDALDLIRIAAVHVVPVPFAETLLANWMLAICGVPLPGGPLSIAIDDEPLPILRKGGGYEFATRAARTPWARHASRIVALVGHGHRPCATAISQSEIAVEYGENLGGEPRDNLTFNCVLDEKRMRPLPSGLEATDVFGCAAALRVISIAGAIEGMLGRTIRYAQERVQFGRPIGKFQAVQNLLAVMAGHSAVAAAAAQIAADAFADPNRRIAIAAAKVAADEAAGASAAIAHQVHGAIGFTREHPLHLYSTRLWSWREEYGNGETWSRRIGAAALGEGAEGLWPFITAA